MPPRSSRRQRRGTTRCSSLIMSRRRSQTSKPSRLSIRLATHRTSPQAHFKRYAKLQYRGAKKSIQGRDHVSVSSAIRNLFVALWRLMAACTRRTVTPSYVIARTEHRAATGLSPTRALSAQPPDLRSWPFFPQALLLFSTRYCTMATAAPQFTLYSHLHGVSWTTSEKKSFLAQADFQLWATLDSGSRMDGL